MSNQSSIDELLGAIREAQERARQAHAAEEFRARYVTNAPNEFITKDSGKREEFETGARRDVQNDKPLFECIPVWALERVAMLYTRGAKKYGLDNWKKGIPFMRMMASLLRHAFQYCQGDDEEDHLAAVCWNALGIMYYEWAIAQGKLPPSLDDRELPVKKEANGA